MGDRTWVDITIHKDFEPLLLSKTSSKDRDELANKVNADEINDDTFMERGDHITFKSYEVNYADWKDLENLLQEAHIEYDKIWGAGGDYDEGEAFHRKVGKKWILQEAYKTDIAQIEILKLILKSKDVKKAAEKQLKKLCPFKQTPLKDGKSNAQKFIEKL